MPDTLPQVLPVALVNAIRKPGCIDWQHDSRSNLWLVVTRPPGGNLVFICGVGETVLKSKMESD